MKIKKHQPLLAVISGTVHRFLINSETRENEYFPLGCYRNYRQPCSVDCSALCLVEYAANFYGFFCTAQNIPLGIIDDEKVDPDYIALLRFGTDLQDFAMANNEMKVLPDKKEARNSKRSDSELIGSLIESIK